MKKITLLLILTAFMSFSAPIPVEILMKKAEITDVTMSYDGKAIAARYTDSTDQIQLFTWDLENNDKNLLRNHLEHYDIYKYKWAGNKQLVYNVGLIKHYRDYLASADLRLINIKNLAWTGTTETKVIDGLVYDTNNVLVIRNVTDKYSRIGLLDIHGRKKTIKNCEKDFPGQVTYWLTDLAGNLKFVETFKKTGKGSYQNFFRESKNKPWERVPCKNNHKLLKFSPDGKTIYASTYYRSDINSKAKTKALCAYDIKNDKLNQTIFSDSFFDFLPTEPDYNELQYFSNIHLFEYNVNDHAKNSLKGITLYNDTATTYWFDVELADIQKRIDNKLPALINIIYDADTSLARFLVVSYSDVKPAYYYLYYYNQDSLKQLFISRPWITPEMMCKTKPIVFKTRDGLNIHGYLTVPKDKTPPFPTIVLLHGGPWFRDYWGFDSEVQLFTNRGYAVLQINYRGSTGYGYEISEKNRFNFYYMRCDVIDGTNYIIDMGIADPRHIAVMGTSCGGYLSLCCVATVPGLYKCAISNAGVFDWEKHILSKYRNEGTAYDFYISTFGAKKDSAYVKSISPIYFIKNIKVPIFLAAGKKDRTVSFNQSLEMYHALVKAGVKVETLFKEYEQHGFFHQVNRVEYYNKVLAFLQKHI